MSEKTRPVNLQVKAQLWPRQITAFLIDASVLVKPVYHPYRQAREPWGRSDLFARPNWARVRLF